METKDDYTKVANNLNPKVSNELTESEVKQKIDSGDYKIVNNPRGRSEVWDVFGIIKDKNDVVIDAAACKICLAVCKYKVSANLAKHECFIKKKKETEKNSANTKDMEKSVLLVRDWTLKNCRPFNIIRDDGLKEFIEFLISVSAKKNIDIDALLPNPTTVSSSITNLYNKHFDIVKSEIASVENIGYGLTSNIRTDIYLRTTYISLTIHFIKEGKLITRLLGLRTMKNESCTGSNIYSKITTLFNDFEIELHKNSILVTDCGSNMIADSFNHISCMNHLIYNVIEESLKDIPEIIETCNFCLELVEYFKKSDMKYSFKTSLKSYDSTRFDTIYLLSSIANNWDKIEELLREQNELKKISNFDISYIRSLLKILSYFKKTSEALEDENYPTLYLTIVHIYRLIKICAVGSEDLEMIKILKNKLKSPLEDILLKNVTLNHKIALFLFPPANKLIIYDEAEKNRIKAECKKLMEGYANSSLVNDELVPLSRDNLDLFADFIQPAEIINSNESYSIELRINKELRDYERVNVIFHENFNVLQWWHLHQDNFPHLYKVSCKILATPASSAASKRVISSARMLVSEERTFFESDSVLIDQIMFLHFNTKQNKNDCNDLQEII